MTALTIFNLVMALLALWLAHCLRRWGRALEDFNQQLQDWPPDVAEDSGFLEIASRLRQGQTRIVYLRQGYGQLQAGVNRWRQMVFLLTMMLKGPTLVRGSNRKIVPQRRAKGSTRP
ncbi:MAG: hypothetical protein KGQ93_08715 [Cyanobacteria bacterium REEB459]|nr:hypothetical protein [Cyanobacteria bacterium REEB459]